jgi:hypothetical protein
LQRQKRLKIEFCQIFGVVRISTFATVSANTGSSHTIPSARGRGLEVKLGPGRQGRVEFARDGW